MPVALGHDLVETTFSHVASCPIQGQSAARHIGVLGMLSERSVWSIMDILLGIDQSKSPYDRL